MKIQQIELFNAHFLLSADDCALLARACRVYAAREEVIEQVQELAWCEAMGAAFRAAAIAGYAQLHLPVAHWRELQGRLEEVGL